jgi:hypothetical protein
MRMLSDLEPEELALLADSDFRESVQVEARSLAADAFDTYTEVMHSSDDDQARLKAADKILSLAGIEEKQTALPLGVSEEVFKIALAGLGQLAGIARASSESSAILRNVTPAKSDPRAATLIEESKDDSPMSRKPITENDNDAIINAISGERYEIIERKG